MHFYCPHPLFLHSSSLLPLATTTSLSSSAALPLAWHPHPSSAPPASILSHSVSLSPLLTQSFFSPASSFSFSDRPRLGPGVHRNFSISICNHFQIFLAAYLTRKQKRTFAGGFLRLLKTNVCEEKQLVSVSTCVTHVHCSSSSSTVFHDRVYAGY